MNAKWLLFIVLALPGSSESADFQFPAPFSADGKTAGQIYSEQNARLSYLQGEVVRLEDERKSIVERLKTHIENLGGRTVGVEKTRVADEIAHMKDILGKFRKHRESVLPTIREVAAFVKRIQSETKSLEVTNCTLKQIATRLPNLSLQQCSDVILNLIQIGNSEIAEGSRREARAHRLSAELSHVQNLFEREIAPDQEFLHHRNIVVPTVETQALAHLREVNAALETRTSDISREIHRLIAAVSDRERALFESTTARETEKAFSSARALAKSADFIDFVNTKVKSILPPGEVSTFQQLPYLEAEYFKRKAVIEFAQICSSSDAAASWMHTGCEILGNEARKAHAYIDRTVPRRLGNALEALGRTDETKTLAAFLEANNYSDATHEHDRLLRKRVAQ